MPKVSVIMGVYNATDKLILEKAINSILNQTFKDFEFIICDDGSSNNSSELVKEICKDDERVVLLQNKENKGLAYVLNKCLEHSKGEYIARMDSDDLCDLTRLEKQVKFLDENKDYGIVGTNADMFDDESTWGELKYNENIRKEDFLYNSPVIHASIMIRKSVYDLVGGYRDIPMTLRVEDYDLFMRIFAKGIKIYTIQENLYKFRVDKNTESRRKYRYRFNEVRVRYQGFKLLKLYPKGIIYVIKPLIVGLLPQRLRRLKGLGGKK